MGYLNLFDQVTRISAGTDAESGIEYWVDVKQYLSNADEDACKKLLFGTERVLAQDKEGHYTAEPDTVGYQNEVVVRSIVNWNLTDRDNKTLPCGTLEERRASCALLPSWLMTKIYNVVNEASERNLASDPRFRAASDGSAEVG